MRAERLLRLLFRLQSGGRVKARHLAAELGVSERTIYRDVEALGRAGIPVYTEPGPHGGIALVSDYRSGLTGLTQKEAEALGTLVPPASFVELGLGAAVEQGLRKLAASLPEVHRLAARHLQRRIHVDTSPWWGVRQETPALATLRRGVFEDRRVRIAYRRLPPVGRAVAPRRRRRLDPLGLVAKGERWYLVADSSAGDRDREPALRVYRVSRIVEVVLLDESFERREDFDLEAFWQAWCAEFRESRPSLPVTFRVTVEGEERLRRAGPHWIPLLSGAKRLADGRREVTFDFERESFAVGSLVPLGEGVEVVEPASLRRRLYEAGRALSALYSAEADGIS